MVMVKPALAYLDVIAAVRAAVDVPRRGVPRDAASTRWSRRPRRTGWIDGDAVALEHLTAIKRAGADIILTYLAREVAELLGSVTPSSRTNDRSCSTRGQRVHPRRRQLAGPGVRLGRRHAVLRRPGRGRRTCGTSRAAATSTYVQSLRRVDPRPRPPGGRRGGAARPRPTARRTARRPSARCCWPRRSCERVPCVEQVRLVSVGHRGDDDRGPPRPAAPPAATRS